MKKKKNTVRDIDKTRRRILDASAKEFARHGLSGARVDAIAKRAKVNKAMIYYIFGNKQDLHLAVLESLFEEKTRNLDEKISLERMSLDELLLMLNDYFDAFNERKEYARIMLYDIAAGGETLRALRKRRPELFEFFGKISTMIKGLSEKGLLREIDPDKSVMMLIMIMVALAGVLPHMDLASRKGSRAYKELSDPDKWKEFLSELLMRAVRERQG